MSSKQTQSSGYWAIAGAVGVVVVAALLWWLLRPAYGKLTPRAYRIALALHSVCNQKDAARLEKLKEHVVSSEDSEAEPLAERERQWLDAIIAAAEKGRWSDAARDSRLLLERQAERAP